jgi:hypothetical protein
MYKQITPSDGWYFVSKDETNGKPIIFAVAAWALVEDGSAVIGLIGEVRGGGQRLPSSSHKSMARLVSVPPIEGTYKHLSTMTPAELGAVKPAV